MSFAKRIAQFVVIALAVASGIVLLAMEGNADWDRPYSAAMRGK
jgi:hypothetical protein